MSKREGIRGGIDAQGFSERSGATESVLTISTRGCYPDGPDCGVEANCGFCEKRYAEVPPKGRKNGKKKGKIIIIMKMKIKTKICTWTA